MKACLTNQIIALLQKKNRVIVALDGRCASGKTTLASELESTLGAQVIHMDDFFLRPFQRTPQRLAEPGGNLDRERFLQEVILPLRLGAPFSYRPYLCGEERLGDAVFVDPEKLVVIEGSYSHHPAFGEPYDLRVFLAVSPEIQRQRILGRPARLHKRFFEEWIPMEEAYFSYFDIARKADLVYSDDDLCQD